MIGFITSMLLLSAFVSSTYILFRFGSECGQIYRQRLSRRVSIPVCFWSGRTLPCYRRQGRFFLYHWGTLKSFISDIASYSSARIVRTWICGVSAACFVLYSVVHLFTVWVPVVVILQESVIIHCVFRASWRLRLLLRRVTPPSLSPFGFAGNRFRWQLAALFSNCLPCFNAPCGELSWIERNVMWVLAADMITETGKILVVDFTKQTHTTSRHLENLSNLLQIGDVLCLLVIYRVNVLIRCHYVFHAHVLVPA